LLGTPPVRQLGPLHFADRGHFNAPHGRGLAQPPIFTPLGAPPTLELAAVGRSVPHTDRCPKLVFRSGGKDEPSSHHTKSRGWDPRTPSASQLLIFSTQSAVCVDAEGGDQHEPRAGAERVE
jgi:hypothetical protein